jgi:threonine/homoserine/homoserine lactone efflux protein
MILKGFRFGMLLQIAIGPMCLFIFQTAATSGFPTALIGVSGIALIDGLYIVAAILGIGALLNRNSNLKNTIKYFGAIILMLFGSSIVLEVFGISIIPSFSFVTQQSYEGVFFKVLILTLSNPLTILFWVGVFSSRLADEQMNHRDMVAFGSGAVLSTIVFLSGIAFAGSFANQFLNPLLLNGLNITVGLVLIGFGIKSVMSSQS